MQIQQPCKVIQNPNSYLVTNNRVLKMVLKQCFLTLALVHSLVGNSSGQCLQGNVPLSTPTTENCDSISGTFTKYKESGTTCAGTDGAFCSTSSKFSFVKAQTECAKSGMRVCTMKELVDDSMATQTSCASTVIWTSTPCEYSPGVVTQLKLNFNSKTVQCASTTETNAFVCCGTSLTKPQCSQCVANAVSKFSDLWNQDYCSCATGYSTTYTDMKMVCSRTALASSCVANQYAVPQSVSACNAFSESTDLNSGHACKVHATSNDECPVSAREKFVDFAYASSYCAERGARLCSVSELQEQDVSFEGKTACKSEKQIVWSNDRCFSSLLTENSYFAVDMSKKDGEVFCLPESKLRFDKTKKLGFRCCADKVVSAPICTSCPRGSTSLAKSKGFTSCTCAGTPSILGFCIPNPPAFKSCSANEYFPSSSRSCTAMRSEFPKSWDIKSTTVSSTFCGSVLDPANKCFAKATYAEAKAKCKEQGARLCTAKEVLSQELREIGRKCKNPTVWTSTYCCDGFWGATSCPNPAGHVVVSTNGKYSTRTCSSDTSTETFACCADEIPASSCSACPTGSTAGSGVNDLDKCSCSSGNYKLNDSCVPFVPATCAANEYSGSRLSIAQKKLTPSRNARERKVAATSKPGKLTCEEYQSKTFAQAKTICEAEGMRLCDSAFELKRGLIFANDFCNFKEQVNVWLGKGCSSSSHWTSNTDSASDVCEANTVTAGVACCVDVEPGSCISCAVGSTSSAGAKYLDSCTCSSGYYAAESSNERMCK